MYAEIETKHTTPESPLRRKPPRRNRQGNGNTGYSGFSELSIGQMQAQAPWVRAGTPAPRENRFQRHGGPSPEPVYGIVEEIEEDEEEDRMDYIPENSPEPEFEDFPIPTPTQPRRGSGERGRDRDTMVWDHNGEGRRIKPFRRSSKHVGFAANPVTGGNQVPQFASPGYVPSPLSQPLMPGLGFGANVPVPPELTQNPWRRSPSPSPLQVQASNIGFGDEVMGEASSEFVKKGNGDGQGEFLSHVMDVEWHDPDVPDHILNGPWADQEAPSETVTNSTIPTPNGPPAVQNPFAQPQLQPQPQPIATPPPAPSPANDVLAAFKLRAQAALQRSGKVQYSAEVQNKIAAIEKEPPHVVPPPVPTFGRTQATVPPAVQVTSPTPPAGDSAPNKGIGLFGFLGSDILNSTKSAFDPEKWAKVGQHNQGGDGAAASAPTSQANTSGGVGGAFGENVPTGPKADREALPQSSQNGDSAANTTASANTNIFAMCSSKSTSSSGSDGSSPASQQPQQTLAPPAPAFGPGPMPFSLVNPFSAQTQQSGPSSRWCSPEFNAAPPQQYAPLAPPHFSLFAPRPQPLTSLHCSAQAAFTPFLPALPYERFLDALDSERPLLSLRCTSMICKELGIGGTPMGSRALVRGEVSWLTSMAGCRGCGEALETVRLVEV